METNHGRIIYSLMPKVMDGDIRGVLIALIIIIVLFAVGMGGYFLR
jgi:flagellar basal body-associated protein FliL